MATAVGKKVPKELLSMSLEQRQGFIESFDHVMVDCDGEKLVIRNIIAIMN